MKLNNLKKAASTLSRFDVTKMLISFCWSGYFEETGWLNSFIQKKPMDKNGNAIPWVTYSFIHFIAERLSPDLVVLEYGSGNSTLFYSRLVKRLYTVEHDIEWFNQMKSRIQPNVDLRHIGLEYDGDYARFSQQIAEPLDVIIVDGRDRVNCIKQSVQALGEGGVIVLDDSEREEYKSGRAFLADMGFKHLDFWGIAPGIFYNKSTSVFYRPTNCLNI